MKNITLKKIATLFIFSLVAVFGYGQTTLSPGEVVITGFNSYGSDQFTFVLLTDITSGTQIHFTDNGWLTTGSFRSGEGTITWTADTNLDCGTEVVITDSSPFESSSGSVTDSAGFQLATGGDQILIYQGPDFNPTFIYAVNFDGAGWLEATNSNTSALPLGLTDGTNAVNLGEIDNGNYNCVVDNDAAAILASVTTPADWNLTNNRIDVLGGCQYFCSSDVVDWCNLQWPDTGNIALIGTFDVYAQVYEPGVTDAAGQGAGVTAWIGFSPVDATSVDDFTSSDWTWILATYNTDIGNNDEYTANIGTSIPYQGTYYYASRFQLNDGPYRYGGYSPAPGGGFWDGTTYVSNVLTVGCFSTTTWDGTIWDNGNPNSGSLAIINADYNTSINVPGSFIACSLTINSGATLTIENGDYIEVNSDIVINEINGLNIRPQGSLVQKNDNSTITGSGTSQITKSTASINNWYEYTYWSSPVIGDTVGNALFPSDEDRRFIFDASSYSDTDGNGIDDEADDWNWVPGTTIMESGVGYAATHSEIGFIGPDSYDYIFTGIPNYGVIEVPVARNDAVTTDINWNFIGNPYPSAIDVDLFFAENVYDAASNPTGKLEGAIYLWSQDSPASAANEGNEQLNFATADYAQINETGELAGGDGLTPSRNIPSGQGFFIPYSDAPTASTGVAVFNNAMRVTGNNDQFFRTASTNEPNKIRVNLTSNNGVFNQILVGYVNGATDAYDGMIYDAPRNLSTGQAAILYTNIPENTRKYAIQGKAPESLDIDEVIYLGFKNAIEVDTQFTLSLAELEGDFMNSHTVYLIDNLLGQSHDLTQSDYTFTSEVGEFNDRFEIRFDTTTLSLDDQVLEHDTLIVKETELGGWNISTSLQSNLSQLAVYDLLGREIHNINVNNQPSVTIDSGLVANSVYIIKVSLNNGNQMTAKVVK